MRKFLLPFVLLLPLAAAADPAGSAFTYQGELWSAGEPANGEFDLVFNLFDQAAGGTPIAAPVQLDDLQIDGGLVNAELDFGASIFFGDAVWVEVAVRDGASTGSYDTLAPRSPITPAPYALFALDGSPGPQGPAGPPGPQGPPGDSQWTLVAGDIHFAGGRVGVGEDTPLAALHVQTNNLSLTDQETFNDDLVVEDSDASIGLYSSGGGGYGSSITLSELTAGSLLDTWGIVRRTALGNSELWWTYGTDPDYSQNDTRFILAPDGSAALGATPVLDPESTLTVEAGGDNFGVLVQSLGQFGSAIGLHAGPAGYSSLAKNAYFDAGWQRFDTNNGAFLMEVAPDGTTTMFTEIGGANPIDFQPTLTLADGETTVNGAFFVGNGSVVTSPGGFFGFNRADAQFPVHVGNNALNGNGARLTTGGTWTDASSRLFKTDFQAIDPQDILQRVLRLPVLRWRYRDSEEGTHLGPIAEDFHALFGLGDTEQYIAGVDRNGVALAAIQGLHQQLEEKDQRIAELERMHQESQRALAATIERIERLEREERGEDRQ
ncbi:tail fiber domain-containing protein [Halomonas denitrificans]|nr:tail fiber domain-containing protein [Halomonas denitrificans]